MRSQIITLFWEQKEQVIEFIDTNHCLTSWASSLPPPRCYLLPNKIDPRSLFGSPCLYSALQFTSFLKWGYFGTYFDPPIHLDPWLFKERPYRYLCWDHMKQMMKIRTRYVNLPISLHSKAYEVIVHLFRRKFCLSVGRQNILSVGGQSSEGWSISFYFLTLWTHCHRDRKAFRIQPLYNSSTFSIPMKIM